MIIFLIFYYLLMFFMGLLTMLTEGDNISGCSRGRKLWSIFTFPFYMATYLPIAVVALFKKVGWKPIQHTVAKSIDDLSKKQ